MNIALPARFRFGWRASPASRVAFGLVALMVSLLLMSDVFVTGFLTDRRDDEARHRHAAAELIATQAVQALRDDDDAALRELLRAALRREPLLRSAAVLGGERTLAIAGDHARHWRLTPGAASVTDQIRLPLLLDSRPWGELQLAFTPARPRSLRDWLSDPIVLGVALMALFGFVAFQLYLRRAMRYLDPSAAVPERVRSAYDTLTEAVLVLDTTGHIMLANRAFHALNPGDAPTDTGADIASVGWLVAALPDDLGLPWQRVLHGNRPVLGIEMRVGAGTAKAREVVMNCSPINDGFKRARGCLITFSDVTELHERTEGLRLALAELLASREEIRQKNDELTLLATRDPLTGCLNRRAFLADSERAIAAAIATHQPLAVIMCDVDHFKSVNDRFGHAGGDEVLKSVSKSLARGLRVGDLLGRYGGEEFCILLPDATLDQALLIAERLRADIEQNAGSAVRHLAEAKITMSFGVERLSAEVPEFAALVDRADQALYHSKKTGRNRVTPWGQLPLE